MRYAFEYFVRQEFEITEEFNQPKDLGFFFESWQIILILSGYFLVVLVGFIIVLRFSKQTVNN